MESNDLLRPELGENQNLEVNAGASTEAQPTIETSEPQTAELPAEETTVDAPEVVAEPAEPAEIPEPQAISEPAETEPSSPQENPTVGDMMAEIENVQNADNEEVEEEETEISIEKIEAEYHALSLEEAVAELEKVVAEADYNKIKQHVGILKAKILEQIRTYKRELLEKFVEEGGNKEEFVLAPLDIEKRFNAALAIFKENKAKYLDALEAEKQRNLAAKQEILEKLRLLVESNLSLKELNDKFKEYQEQWKEIGAVPQNESNNLWQNYHFYVEKFFDLLRIGKELRSLDLKKNLEQKIKLCETAESLLLQDSINKSFKTLQQLHDEWKEIGPVAEEKKEEIWERFKNASDQINQRRREYYDKLYSEQQNNYNAKVVLCEKAEELIAGEAKTIKENNAISDQLTELLKVWKTLGPAPSKLNDEIWARFKASLDKFFQEKKDYFQQLKEVQMQNYNQKLNLAIQAEAIAERTDWRAATDDILKLQKEWKEIGAVPRRQSEQVWKRFRSACDKFFEAKSHYFANIQDIEAENLRKKEELIQKILTHEFTDDKVANMEAMKSYQREWTELGFVPRKEKDRIYGAYRDAVNKRFADLKVSAEDRKRDNFKTKIDTILNNPDADRLLDKEKRFLTNKLAQLKEDIILWENNLGFFANSKNADLLKAEFSKKIEAAKGEVKELEFKIKMMNQPK